jgi:hypothetical protein
MDVNPNLVKRIKEDLVGGDKEEVVLITRRDPIVILPKVVSYLLWTSILGLNVYAFWNVGIGKIGDINTSGLISRLLLVPIAVIWIKFFSVDFWNYQYELLAITYDKELEKVRGYYKVGKWVSKIHNINVKSMVSGVIDQSKHKYDRILSIGNIKLDVFGSEDDVYFSDCPFPMTVIQAINRLSK